MGVQQVMGIKEDVALVGRHSVSYLSDITSKQIKHADQTFSYLDAGEGETVVLLHGFGVSKSVWRPLMSRLSRDYHVVAFDIPGYNLAASPKLESYGFRRLTEWLQQAINAVVQEPQRNIHLVGYSVGAILAAYYAANAGEKSESLVMIGAPTLYVDSSLLFEKRFEQSKKFNPTNIVEFKVLMGTLFNTPPYIPDFAIKRFLKDYETSKPAFEKLSFDICQSAPMVLPKLANVQCPTLHVISTNDKWSDSNTSAILQSKIPQLKTLTLENCGHLSIIEKPYDLAKHITHFIASSATTSV